MDLSIIVPCYNEAENTDKLRRELLPVLAGLAGRDKVELLLVDDGSTDRTLDALEALLNTPELGGVEARILRHTTNRGLGAALRTGFAAARGSVIVTTDSDGTYRFTEIPTLLHYIDGGADIVTASPYHPQGGVEGVPAYRLVLSRGSSLLYRLTVNPRIHTYTALFRAYRRRVIDTIPFESDGFLAGTELLVKASLAGYRVVECPAVLHVRQYGASKAKIARTIRAHLGFQSRIVLGRLDVPSVADVRPSLGGKKWA